MNTVSVGDIERTQRDVSIAQWGVASVVMAGSAFAAASSFSHLGQSWTHGVAIALGIDLALAMWLRIDGRLREFDVRRTTGMALEGVALAMTMFLNVGAALFDGVNPHSATARGLLAIAYVFLPIILFLVSIAGPAAQRALGQRHREVVAQQDATSRAEREARQRAEAEQVAQHRADGTRMAVSSLAVALTLGARTARVSEPATRAKAITSKPAEQPVPTPPARESRLSRARAIRADHTARELPFNRSVLMEELGIGERDARKLITALNRENTLHSVKDAA